ncbi:MAG: hypothetical protein JW795_21615 [Chitinivibrionales bacterium]|nr:hypothetical protein [Chitinivibrionales bacterium]
MEQEMEQALMPGVFISYNDTWSFVEGLESVANAIEKIIPKEPQRVADLFETFIAACHEKAEEIDDSNGQFGMFVEELFGFWIKARQAMPARANIIMRLWTTSKMRKNASSRQNSKRIGKPLSVGCAQTIPGKKDSSKRCCGSTPV